MLQALQKWVQYVFLSSRVKTEEILKGAEKDAFFADITAEIRRGIPSGEIEFQHRYWGRLARYSPILDGQKTHLFQFSSRFGEAVVQHYALHEMMHFWQQEQNILTEAFQHPAIYAFCEVWAEVEAIRASWRLKEQGILLPWQGAMTSPDWRELAKMYQTVMEAEGEVVAAKAIWQEWHEGELYGYYYGRAKKLEMSTPLESEEIWQNTLSEMVVTWQAHPQFPYLSIVLP